MNHFYESKSGEASSKLQVWMCHGCQAVHFKVGNVMLNFTRGEFVELTKAILEIYSGECDELDFLQLVKSLDSSEDEVLSSHTIS